MKSDFSKYMPLYPPILNSDAKFQTENLTILSKNQYFVQRGNEFFPIVITNEEICPIGGEPIFQKTLRIYDDEKNFKLIKCLLLESYSFKPANFEKMPASFMHYGNHILYFKRVYRDPGDGLEPYDETEDKAAEDVR